MSRPTGYSLLGVAGYIAPRHMRAMADTGGELRVSCDPNDSVGVIDSHFPESYFFTQFEHFDDFIHTHGEFIDYLTICSPNHLHESHIKYGLRNGMDVICEKPLVLNEAGMDRLLTEEAKSGQKVSSILQLRLHDDIVNLKRSIDSKQSNQHQVELTYITSRGRWYEASWKGDEKLSGGVTMNIGVHFFDMLGFLFGELDTCEVYQRDSLTASGYLEFEKAQVRWFLSVDSSHLPLAAREKRQRTYRDIVVDGSDLEFSGGFTELHTRSYQNVLDDRGFGIDEVRQSIRLVNQINSMPIVKKDQSKSHRFLGDS